MLINKINNFIDKTRENHIVSKSVLRAAILVFRQSFCRNYDIVYSGLSLNSLPFVSRHRDWLGVQDVVFEGEYAAFLKILDGVDSPRVIDGGANIGMFALYVLARFPNSCVRSYEASQLTYDVLERNRGLNQDLDWTVKRVALWSSCDQISFGDMEWSTSSRVGGSSECSTVVPGLDLPSVISEIGSPVDLMKIDIEGSEEAFICANEKSLDDVRNLIIEIHPGE